jgi:hypothetical protein
MTVFMASVVYGYSGTGGGWQSDLLGPFSSREKAIGSVNDWKEKAHEDKVYGWSTITEEEVK